MNNKKIKAHTLNKYRNKHKMNQQCEVVKIKQNHKPESGEEKSLQHIITAQKVEDIPESYRWLRK